MTAPPAPSMTKLERELLDATAMGELVFALRSDTRVDTGRWLGRSPLWLCVTDREIVLLAASKRRHAEGVPLADAGGSWYSHATGQLVIETEQALRFDHVAMSPTDALRVLKHIQQALEPTHPTHPVAMKESHA